MASSSAPRLSAARLVSGWLAVLATGLPLASSTGQEPSPTLAVASLETAAKIDPEKRSVRLNLEKAYLKVGKPAEAGAALERFLAGETSPEIHMASARVIGGDSADVGSRVRDEIATRVRPERKVREPSGLRLRVSLDRRGELAVEPSVYCEPRFASPGSGPPQALPRTDFRKMERAGPVTLRVHVDERGRVVKVEIAKSSGVPAVDQLFAAMAADDRFQPALLDGQPVPGTTEVRRRLTVGPARP